MIADQVTKHVVTSTLAVDESEHVIGPLSIHHVQNSGIAFGLFSSATVIVTLVTAGAVIWMLVFFARSGARHPVLPAALGLLIGGSVSNLVDRIRLRPRHGLHRRPGGGPRSTSPTASSSSASRSCSVALIVADRTPKPPRRTLDVAATVIVPPEAAGERLDRFLAGQLGSRAAAERAVEAGALVDGVARAKSYRLAGGEEVELRRPARRDAVAPPPAAPPIVWEDEHLLVIDKPAGPRRASGRGHASGTLVDALAGRIAGGEPERPGIVHRLDRDTSGSWSSHAREEAYERLTRARARARARAHATWRSSRGGRGRGPAGSRRRSGATATTRRASRSTPTRRARRSRTSRWSSSGREQCAPAGALETGRMHQIRVHLAAIDLPVVGDPIYGIPEPALGRQFLHASELAFPHPFSGERAASSRSELPPDLARVPRRLA